MKNCDMPTYTKYKYISNSQDLGLSKQKKINWVNVDKCSCHLLYMISLLRGHPQTQYTISQIASSLHSVTKTGKKWHLAARQRTVCLKG